NDTNDENCNLPITNVKLNIHERELADTLDEDESSLQHIVFDRKIIKISAIGNVAQHRQRSVPNLRIALTVNNVEENYLGSLSVACSHCGAFYFPGEARRVSGCFNACCNFGNISLNLFSEFPELFHSFFTGTDALCKNFRQHIRSYNSALAMASMGAQVDTPRGSGPYCYRIHGQVYHYAGPLTPKEGIRPQFGQVYILDTDSAAAERSGNPANAECSATVMQLLTSWLHTHNSYAVSLQMMGSVAAEEERRALAEGREVPTIRMIFEDVSNLDRRRYNVPAANEIAVVYVGEDNDVPATRALAIHHKRDGLQLIRDIDGCCDPLTYPLLFPRGGLCWHVDLTKNPSGRSRTRITQREFYSNLLALRSSFNPLHHAGKLLQQFVVDAYVKIEQNRLNYMRTHQKELRIDSYRGLMDHLASDNVDGPPGQRVILPSSFPGSPRAMHQSYQDAMSIVAKYGKPDYFLTFTCNPQWREIKENLFPGQSASDRPDLVARVFHRKLKILHNYLFEKKVLGSVAAYVGIVEWQKRGLPHCHMLLIMTTDAKPRSPEDVDAAVQAQIPNASENPRLLGIVAKNMIHRQCGATNPTAPCMVNGECAKRYPKEYRETTDVDVDGYPKYRRPDNGRTVTTGGKIFDNRHVVPYNRYLLLLLNAHINLEICGYLQAVKYLYKYVYKGPDRASLRLLQQDRSQKFDEIRAHLDARYVCAPEALHHIFSYECQFKSDTVCRLPVHLPDFQSVTFQSGEEREAAVREAAKDSMLTAWFKLNSEYEIMGDNAGASTMVDPRTLYYHQLPEHFTFVKERKWKRRERSNRQIGRMHTVPPNDPERFSLRILLLHRKNIRSFEDLRTVEGRLHLTFLDAARALGLLHDDSHYESCLEEAARFQMPAELRALFSYMLAFCEISDPRNLYDRFKSDMAEDFIYRGSTEYEAEALAYFDLYDRLQVLRYDLSVRIPLPAQSRPVLPDQTDYAYHDQKGKEMYQCLNQQQKLAADDILASSVFGRGKLHFVDGPGGSGKTYLYNAIYHILKGERKSVVCVAWTGIAASLLPEGRTASSTFKLNMKSGNRECSMRREAKEATILKEASTIIWDEISMVPRFSLEAVDLLLQDLMCTNELFGGKTVVLGGDFRQVLPIVERGRECDMIDACVKNSQFWKSFRMHRLSVNMRAAESGSSWCDFLMSVGNGEASEDEAGRIQLPTEIISNGNLIDEVFGDLLTDFETLSERAILTPRNLEAHRINEEALEKLPGLLHEYRSIDDVVSEDSQSTDYTSEFLNSLAPAGLPPHKLRMKEGSIVMLLRNLDVRNGLCNGTRLIVTHFGRFVLGCRFACGERKGKFVLIPRIDNYTDTGVPFRLRRRQFPLRLSFAMTINKAQGQSLSNVGVCLATDVFSHGQLYVALSRARRKEGLKVHKNEDRVTNVVI
ncbi:unnamed protein product, partial [Cylicostephanus goldi]